MIRDSRYHAHAIELLKGKWKMQILCAIRSHPVRLGQLMRLIPLASKKVIVATLRELESSQIIVRRDLSRNIRHVEYDFAEGTRSAITTMLDHLAEMGQLHLSHISASTSHKDEGLEQSVPGCSNEFAQAPLPSAILLQHEQSCGGPTSGSVPS